MRCAVLVLRCATLCRAAEWAGCLAAGLAAAVLLLMRFCGPGARRRPEPDRTGDAAAAAGVQHARMARVHSS